MTTDEQKLIEIETAIHFSIKGVLEYSEEKELAKDILNRLKQLDPESLEVNVFTEGEPTHSLTWVNFEKNFVSDKEAQAFCAKHGLKIK